MKTALTSLTFSNLRIIFEQEVLYVYLFKRDSYFSGISAEASALIHEYANIFNNNEM